MSYSDLPPLPPPRGKRRKVFAIRLTVSERRQIERAARLAGLKASEWGRDLLVRAVKGQEGRP